MAKPIDLIQGTLDMLILKAVSLRPLHGYGILLRIQQLSTDVLQIPQGSLYPALYRLETNGLVDFEWGESENRRKAKFYRLTPRGKKHLRAEEEQWDRLCLGIAAVMAATPESV
jgi:PadR family transcriptional regulator PadR